MKLNLKMIAIAVAMVSGSAAHADLLTNSTGNSSFALTAFNTSTGSYYVRDLGYTLNSFLPSSVTTTAIDGGGSAVTGTMSSEAGNTITWGDTGGAFATWLSAQTAADVKWTVSAGDGLTAAGTSNLTRALVALSQTPTGTSTNQVVRNIAGTAAGTSGLAGQNNPMGYSATGATVLSIFTTNNSFGAETLSSLDLASSLFYFTTTAGTGSSTVAATKTAFANSLNAATLTLSSAGVLTYDLAPAAAAVPLPASVWMMGAGLAAIGGMIRRRKAAAEQA